MIKPKHYYEEDRPLLVLAVDSEKLTLSQPVYEAAVTRGAVNYLERWPAHVLAAFVAGCLVFTAFVIFGIIMAILAIPYGEKPRISRNIDADVRPNVYFIKHENRTWNLQELCYIETTARTYQNLTVYLINLIPDNQTVGHLSRLVIQLLDVKDGADGEPISIDIFNRDDKSPMIKGGEYPEQEIREKLASFNRNIKNIDVPIRRFFNGSRLARVCNHLSQSMVEMAAKAYVLWNFPGVALDPAMYQNLELLKGYLCKNDGPNGCLKDSTATIELNGGIQASSVQCQAFLDHLIREIAGNEFPDQQYTLKKAINDFCPRSSQCRGVRLLNGISKSEVLPEKLNCPTIQFPKDGEKKAES